MTLFRDKNKFYELEELNSIPILEVGHKLGLKIVRNKAYCFGGHDNKTASLSFNTKFNYWHCFGCGQGGNNISLVQKVLNISFQDAIHWLISQYILNPVRTTVTIIKNKSHTYSLKNNQIISEDTMPDIKVYNWFLNQLDLSSVGREYLRGRGLKDSTIDHFKIRDIPNPTKYFNSSVDTWGVERLLKAGLVKISTIDKSKYKLVWWDHTLIFPFREKDDVIYLQGRRLKVDNYGKYINLIGRKKIIFNLNVISKIRPNDNIYLCEGVMDAIAAYQEGIPAIAILGQISLSKFIIELLMPFEITFIRDTDKSGEILASKIADIFSEYGKIITILLPKRGKDLSEYFQIKSINKMEI